MTRINSIPSFIYIHTMILASIVFLMSSSAMAQESDQNTDAIALTITMGEMYFQLEDQDQNAAINLEAGKTYDVHLKNVGEILHEVQFGRNPDMSSGIAHDFLDSLFEGSEVVSVINDLEVVSPGLSELKLLPGQEIHVQFTLSDSTKGDWQIACFQPGHYEAGMFAPVSVK